jgi:hypothetical protein
MTHDEPKRNFFLLTPIRDYRKHLFSNWPANWPRKENHAIQHDVSVKQYKAFSRLINRAAGETDIEAFLRKNHEVLSMTINMFSTGHHMSWIFPKEQIRPPSGPVGGLIPDYLLAGPAVMALNGLCLNSKVQTNMHSQSEVSVYLFPPMQTRASVNCSIISIDHHVIRLI